MSGEDNFLARWSQRKRDAKRAERERDTEAAVVAKDAVSDDGKSLPPGEAASDAQDEKPFDLESLPKLDELTSASDIRGYLQKGVPDDLRNAALRKVWALDPVIRDYVSPALDYAYDWNVPGGVPGNGELAPGTDVASMVARVFGGGPDSSALQNAANVIEQVAPQPAEQNVAQDSVRRSHQTDQIDAQSREVRQNLDRASTDDVQQAGISSEMDSDTSPASQQKPRRHGGAMPHL
ncbi:MAG: DUF3306 domain-containing protein [Pseudomonadota bacterium]